MGSVGVLVWDLARQLGEQEFCMASGVTMGTIRGRGRGRVDTVAQQGGLVNLGFIPSAREAFVFENLFGNNFTFTERLQR